MENLIKIIEYINPAQLVAITVIMCFFIIDLIKKSIILITVLIFLNKKLIKYTVN